LPGRDQQTVVLVEQFGNSADVGRNDGPTGCQRLEHDVGTALAETWEAENVSGRYPRCHFSIRPPPEQSHSTIKAVFAYQRLERTHERSVSENDELGSTIPHFLSKHLEPIDQDVRPLLGLKVSYITDQRARARIS